MQTMPNLASWWLSGNGCFMSELFTWQLPPCYFTYLGRPLQAVVVTEFSLQSLTWIFNRFKFQAIHFNVSVMAVFEKGPKIMIKDQIACRVYLFLSHIYKCVMVAVKNHSISKAKNQYFIKCVIWWWLLHV